MKFSKIIGLIFIVLIVILAGLYGTMRAGLWNPTYESVVAKYAAPPSTFITIDGARLHVRDEGAGRPLVLLHGSIANLHEWDLIAERLKSHYRVIRLDWPPYGISVDPGNVYSTPRAAELLAGLIDHLGLKTVTIVATSNGGNVGLTYAADHPDRIDAMAFSVLPLSRPLSNRPTNSALKAMSWFFTNLLPNYRPKWYYQVMFDTTAGPNFKPTSAELDAFYDQDNIPGAADRQGRYIAANIKLMDSTDVAVAAEKVTAPVLLQWCDLDTVITPPTKGDDAKARFKNAQVTLIHYTDVGHFPEFEIPDRFTKDLVAFLDQLPTYKEP